GGSAQLSEGGGNGEDGRELDLGVGVVPAEEAGEQPRRERRGPTPAPLGVPDRSAPPCQRPEQKEGDAVAIASLAAARPRHPQQAPAGDASQGRPEAAADPCDRREEAEDT